MDIYYSCKVAHVTRRILKKCLTSLQTYVPVSLRLTSKHRLTADGPFKVPHSSTLSVSLIEQTCNNF